MNFLTQNQAVLQFFTGNLFGISWLDIAIAIILIFYSYEGYAAGLLAALLDLGSFLLSFILALKFYAVLGAVLSSNFTIPQGFGKAIAFFIIAFLAELLLGILFRRLLTILLRKHTSAFFNSKINNILGIIPGLFSGIILLAFLLTLIIALPVSPVLKKSVVNGKLSSILVANTQGFEKSINSVFGGAVNDTLNFLTVEPQSNEMVQLHFKTTDVVVDNAAEQAMFTKVNKERTSRGFEALVFDNNLRDLARAHSTDMFARGYFSHYTPDGLSPFDRMAKANINYTYAGENLALAPNTDLAMQGLMNSPGHKANILSPNFRRIGIGVLESDIYGEMFTQEFTD